MTAPLIVRSAETDAIERGAGARTVPLLGKWNADGNRVTSGITTFEPGVGLPLHTHNVEEAVLVLDGEAIVTLEDDEHRVAGGDLTWIPAGVRHRFRNAGTGPLRFYWVYGGRDVTRTLCATGETVEHLSEHDRRTVRD